MDTDWPTLLPVLLQSVQETLVMVTATIVLSGIAGLIIGAALYASRPVSYTHLTLPTILLV